MNKREAFDAWSNRAPYKPIVREAFEAGWQAALAAVKAGGIKAYEGKDDRYGHYCLQNHTIGITEITPLYRLLEDKDKS